MIDVYSIIAAIILIVTILYWVKSKSSERYEPVTTKTSRPDPTGRGGIASARGYDESFSPSGKPRSSIGPLPVRKDKADKIASQPREHAKEDADSDEE